MQSSDARLEEDRFERLLANLLRIGVLASAFVILCGGVIYLCRHSTEPADYSTFQDEHLPELRSPQGIVASAADFRGRGIIQLGLLLLIATPVARVVFSIAGFARQRDGTFISLTLVVLAVLLYSLFLEGP